MNDDDPSQPRGARRAERAAIDVAVAAPAWRRALSRPVTQARAAAAAALAVAGLGTGPLELSIRLSDDAEVRRLNARYRRRDTATNVLAFPLDEPARAGRPRPLGDVVIALETTRREAAAMGRPLAHHLAHLVVHGVLHLAGYDHQTEAEAAAMEAREAAALARLGIADPYHLDEARA